MRNHYFNRKGDCSKIEWSIYKLSAYLRNHVLSSVSVKFFDIFNLIRLTTLFIWMRMSYIIILCKILKMFNKRSYIIFAHFAVIDLFSVFFEINNHQVVILFIFFIIITIAQKIYFTIFLIIFIFSSQSQQLLLLLFFH